MGQNPFMQNFWIKVCVHFHVLFVEFQIQQLEIITNLPNGGGSEKPIDMKELLL
jgi:hypothetical protein